VFIFKHYFASISFAAVREAFSNVYLEKEVLSKTTILQLVTILGCTKKTCLVSECRQSLNLGLIYGYYSFTNSLFN
jgi:hypothetical protein